MDDDYEDDCSIALGTSPLRRSTTPPQDSHTLPTATRPRTVPGPRSIDDTPSSRSAILERIRQEGRRRDGITSERFKRWGVHQWLQSRFAYREPQGKPGSPARRGARGKVMRKEQRLTTLHATHMNYFMIIEAHLAQNLFDHGRYIECEALCQGLIFTRLSEAVMARLHMLLAQAKVTFSIQMRIQHAREAIRYWNTVINQTGLSHFPPALAHVEKLKAEQLECQALDPRLET